MKSIKVSSKSRPNNVAGALANMLKEKDIVISHLKDSIEKKKKRTLYKSLL